MTVIWLQRIAMAIILTAAFLFLKNSHMEKNETRKSNSMMGIKNSDSYDLNFDAESNIRACCINRTVSSNILIFNRISKCGSTSIQNLLRDLSKQNRFKYEASGLHLARMRILSKAQEEALLKNVLRHKDALYVYDRHYYL